MRYILLTIFLLFLFTQLFASPPKVEKYDLSQKIIARYEKVEISVTKLSAEFANPFDTDEITIGAIFTSPSGKDWAINGFYDGSKFLIRFSPDDIGKWSFYLSVKDKNGQNFTLPDEFDCVSSKHHGRLSISPFDSHYLTYSDSTAFIGIGQNRPFWVERFPQFWNLMSSNNCNIFTYWVPSWDHALLLSNNCEQYDSFSAHQIDAIIEKCEKNDIHLIFTIWNDSWLRDNSHEFKSDNCWEKNPFRHLTPKAKDFFKDEKSWTSQEKYYQYIISRWGYSRAIALWQTISDIEKTNAFDNSAKWHHKISTYFKEHDPFLHPVTSFISNEKYYKDNFASTDIPQVHAVELQQNAIGVALEMATLSRQMTRHVGKPNMVGKLVYNKNEETAPDRLHNALWSSLTNGAAILPLSWENDNDFSNFSAEIYNHLGYVSNFVSGLNIDKMDLQPMEFDNISGYKVWGLLGPFEGFGWILNENPEEKISQTLNIVMGDNSTFEIMWYNTWTGKTITAEKVFCVNKKITISTPVFAKDIAFYITKKRKEFISEDFSTSLNGWEMSHKNWSILDGALMGVNNQLLPALVFAGGHSWTHYTCATRVKLLPGSVAELWVREFGLNSYAVQLSGKKVSLLKYVQGHAEILSEVPFEFDMNEWAAVRFSVFDNQLTLSIKDQLILNHEDNSYLFGGVGLGVISGTCFFDDIFIERDTTPPKSPILLTPLNITQDHEIKLSGSKSVDSDSVVLIQKENLPFYAKMIDDTTWSASMSLLTPGPNKISLYAIDKSGNRSDTSSAYVSRYEGDLLLHEQFDRFDENMWENINGDWGSDSLYVKATSWQDQSFLIYDQNFGPNYSVGFRCFVPENKAVYVPFYWQDQDNHYRLRIQIGDHEEDVVRFERILEGGVSQLGESDVLIKTEQWPEWMTCFVHIEGSTFFAYVNGQMVLEATDNAFTQGKTGFGVNQVGALFDDLIVFRKAITLVEEIETTEMTYRLEQNYPNPFNPTTNIRFSIPFAENVSLYVYNVLGKKVATLLEEVLGEGEHEIEWGGIDDQGNPISAGVYFYELKSGDFQSMRKMIYAK